MLRYLKPHIVADLEKKMVFVAGPRQSGKTTLALDILGSSRSRYYNWDDDEDREKIVKRLFPSSGGIFVLDEIHKYKRWRNLLKGLYDKRGKDLNILVTGSAKLDYYRRGGDSLQGRYNFFRLHPLSLKETGVHTIATLRELMTFGGFPEPFLLKSEAEARKWSRQYRTRLIREDLIQLEKVQEVSLLEQLAIRLPDCVGSPLSLNSLREDLQVSHQTISRWVIYLENLYSVFRIYPFGAPKIRAVKKEAKHYHFDWTLVEDIGSRFENMIACHLLKWCHFVEDTEGWDMELRYFRDVDKREVDFVILKNRRPIYFIEAKISQTQISDHLKYLHQRFPQVPAIQLCLEKDVDVTNDIGIRLCNAVYFLRDLV